MKKILVIILVVVLAIGIVYYFNRGESTSTEQNTTDKTPAKSIDNIYKGVPIYFRDQPVNINDLREEQQVAVNFMIDYMSSDKKETEQERFERIKHYLQPDDTFTGEEKFLPDSSLHLDKINVIGTYEYNVKGSDEFKIGYNVFLQIEAGDLKENIPLSMLGDTYIVGYNQYVENKINLFQDKDYIKEANN